ncbi:hypothetical protein PSTT_07012 [Puccinia striiformis]|uniref:Uncharacterized protein n=1 Tax=Puccinia striiformis TaxID=27350 RepID=A0A2S4VI20_9BASI|nr:hypothetical protein PSTT_07012 [Puccinia striiformis]
MMMTLAHNPRLLIITFLLVSYSEYSISIPHPLTEPPTIDALGHVPESSFNEFDGLEPIIDLQTLSPRCRKAPEISGNLLDNLGICSDRAVDTAIASIGDSSEQSNHATISPTSPGRVGPEGGGPLNHPQIGSPASSESIVGPTALVSRKRSREELEARNETQLNQQKQAALIQDLLGGGAEPLGSMECIVGHTHQSDFRIMNGDVKWLPLFAWADTSTGKTEDSSMMKDFETRFNDLVQKLNTLSPSKTVRENIRLSNMAVELYPIDRGLYPGQGRHIFMIQPAGLRGYSRQNRSGALKGRIYKILEALGIFHGLAVSIGLDTKILGSLEDLLEWYWAILFERTEDGPPLFGLFQGTWEAAEQADEQFGSLKRVMSMVLANLESSEFYNVDKTAVALSLLSYWYNMNASRLGGLGSDTDHADQLFWEKMVQVSQSRPINLVERDVLRNEGPEEVLLFTGLDQKALNLFLKSINAVRRNGVCDIGSTIPGEILTRLTEYTSRSRFDLDHEKKINIKGSPLHLIPITQDRGPLIHHQVFTGILSYEEMSKCKWMKVDMLERRIIPLLKSLDVVHRIASEILGEPMKACHKNLVEWFSGILFEKSYEKLPIFGWIKVPSSSPDLTQCVPCGVAKRPPNPSLIQSLEGLFGRAHLYLSRKLFDSGRQSQHLTHSMAITLFGIWYEDIALIHTPLQLQDDLPHSYKDLIGKMTTFFKSDEFKLLVSASS